MKVLAVDTSTEACSAALWVDGEASQRFQVQERGHAQLLPGMVAELLSEAGLSVRALDALVAGVGPGGFTGVRVGVAYIKGLALGLDRPVVGVSSLAMLAFAAAQAHPALECWWSAIDARMGEVYSGIYQVRGGGVELIGEERVHPPTQAMPVTEGGYGAVGSGWDRYTSELTASGGHAPVLSVAGALPEAAAGLRLAMPVLESGRAWSAQSLAPVYLRNQVAKTLVEQGKG